MVEREVFSARSTAVKTTPSHARNSLLLKSNKSGGFSSGIFWVPSSGLAIDTCKETSFTQEGFNRCISRIPDGFILNLKEPWKSQKKGLLEIVKRKDDQILEEMHRCGDSIPAFVKDDVHVTEDMIEQLSRESLIEDREPAYMKIEKQKWISLRAGIMEAIKRKDESEIRMSEYECAWHAKWRYNPKRRSRMRMVVMNFEKKSR